MLREWHDTSASRGARQRGNAPAASRSGGCRAAATASPPPTSTTRSRSARAAASSTRRTSSRSARAATRSRPASCTSGGSDKAGSRARRGRDPAESGRARSATTRSAPARPTPRPAAFLEPRVGASRFLGRLRRDFGRNARSRPLNPNTSSPPRTARRRLERRRASVLGHTLSRTRKRARRPACVCVF
jgi:hypothetical protein